MSDVVSSFLADVRFLPLDESGRRAQPFDHWPLESDRRVPPPEAENMYFLPDARFEEDETRNDYLVGLLIEWQNVAANGLDAKIRFSLRSDDGGRLRNVLHPGSRFVLYEGKRPLAHGCITSEPEAIAVDVRFR